MGSYPRRRYFAHPCSLFVVTLTVKTRKVTVKGPKGEITKDFRHMPVEMQIKKQKTKKRKGLYLNIKMWFGGAKQSSSVPTLKSLIRNMITGVTNVRQLLS
jgi:large subunit ribosomal protein L9e